MTNDYERQRQERIAAAKKRRRKEARDKFFAGLLVAAVIIVLVAALVILCGLITMLAWNYGVVALVAACGGSVSKIGLITAVCANLAIGVISRIFRRDSGVTTTS